jgi:hypothetical protein
MNDRQGGRPQHSPDQCLRETPGENFREQRFTLQFEGLKMLSRRLDTMVCMGPVQQMRLVVKKPRSRRRPQCSAQKCVGGIVLLPIRRQVNSMGTQADCFVAETVYEPAARFKPGLRDI